MKLFNDFNDEVNCRFTSDAMKTERTNIVQNVIKEFREKSNGFLEIMPKAIRSSVAISRKF